MEEGRLREYATEFLEKKKLGRVWALNDFWIIYLWYIKNENYIISIHAAKVSLNVWWMFLLVAEHNN